MSLFLFPSRVRWANPDGTLTPEAYRSLQALLDRVGGTLGDQGTDSFGDINGDPTQSSVNVAYTDVAQPAGSQMFDQMAEVLLQPRTADNLADVLFQTAPDRAMTAAEAVTPGASPYTFTANRDGQLIVRAGTVSLIEYLRNGTATTIGLTAGLFPLLLGDGIRITYTVVPTVTFIPR
ncbi:MAG: hypothetical protein WCR59_00575 [Planctomycetota bacterium]